MALAWGHAHQAEGRLASPLTAQLALVLAGVCGYFKHSWLSIQLIGFSGGLVARWWFKNTPVDQRLSGLASHFLFNIIVYMAIACVGYALGWAFMRLLRKTPED